MSHQFLLWPSSLSCFWDCWVEFAADRSKLWRQIVIYFEDLEKALALKFRVQESLCTLLSLYNPNSTFSFPAVGVNLFYFCIIIYLYGDLAIYAAAVPVSLMQVTW